MPFFPFIKAEALGNDFVMLHKNHFKNDKVFIQKLADRRRGIGFDQLIVYTDDCEIRFFNRDGSEAEACGNGTRCVGFFLAHQRQQKSLTLKTLAGPLSLTVLKDSYPFGQVKVTLQPPKLMLKTEELTQDIHWFFDQENFINIFAVDVGNPHLILFLQDMRHVNIQAIAPQLEHHPFFKRGANISFISMKKEGELCLRVWERGVGATPACGTAAYAASFSYHLLQPQIKHVKVVQEGGELFFDQIEDQWFMTGEARILYAGEFYN